MAKKITLIISLVLLVCFSTVLLVDALDDSNQEQPNILENDTTLLLDSPLFTAMEEDVEFKQKNIDMTGFEKVLSNSNLELWMDDNQVLRIKNINTGYIWGSDLPEYSDVVITNTMEALLKSPVSLSLYNTETNTALQNKTTTYGYEYDGFTLEMDREIDEMSNKITVSVKFVEYKVSFKFSIKLQENGISLHLDNKSIKETGKYVILNMSFYQFLGSVNKNSVPGYIVVPSGNGGLIRYTEHSNISQAYSATFYGRDYNQADNTNETLSLPMFGFVHGVEQDACLVAINEGDVISKFNYTSTEYGEYPGFHSAYASFLFREVITLSLPSVEKPINICPVEHYTSNIDVTYTFLEGESADYVGIAQEYKAHLTNRKELQQHDLTYPMPMHVEAFGREYEEGLLFKEYHNMTTINDILNINAELTAAGVENILYTLRGYYKGGYSNNTYSNIKFDSALGQLSSLKDLEYYMYYNPVESYSKENKEASYVLIKTTRDYVSTVIEVGAKYRLITNVNCVISGVEAAQEKYGSNLMFAGITENLYGDYDNNYTKEQALASYEELMGANTYPMYSPNKYFLDNTSKYLNIDLYHEKLTFITDSVPLLQIVLRGSVDMYSTFINFSSNQDVDRLKCVEYGVYPAYLITQQPSHKLSNTLSNNFYATEYDRVKERMSSDYTFIAGALNEVYACEIVDREVIAPGVIKVSYGIDGLNSGIKCHIVVNYTNEDQPYGNTIIKSMGYEVINNG